MKRNVQEIKARARKKSAVSEDLRRSVKYKRVVGLLVDLDLLIAADPISKIVNKIELADVLEIGRKVEPRVLEVLPAAILSSPASFLHLEKAPADLMEVVHALQKGTVGPDFAGIPFKKIYEAANRPVRDRRRKRASERRISKTFRFSQSTWAELKERSMTLGMGYTRYLEFLIEKDIQRHS